MKIYTKTGDGGETGLTSGVRVSKDSLRTRAYGEIDELNAALGVCRAQMAKEHTASNLEKILHQLQRELFELGADLSTPLDSKVNVPRARAEQVEQLENWIDEIDAKLEPLTHFILPGGGLLGAHLHLARTICRRAERSIVALNKAEAINQAIIVYVNRLSDLLFMMARLANLTSDAPEEKWMG